MEIIQIAHVQITVSPDQENQAKDFYSTLLGLEELPKPETLKGRGGFWLNGKNIQIHIAIESGINRELTKAHVAYEVKDLNQTEKILRDKGFTLSSGPEIPGYIRFETRDPFGNRIEFMQKR